MRARVWREYLIDIHPNLNPPARGAVTTVDGRELVTLGTLFLTFELGADSFPVKAHVIEGLAFDVIIGRDFLKEFCPGIDFMNNVVEFVLYMLTIHILLILVTLMMTLMQMIQNL